jgi:hypothetical protein
MSVALAGNNFGEGTIPRMLLAGIVVLALSALAIPLLWRLRGLHPDDLPWLALWLFSVASIFAITLGRSFTWTEMVTPSRFLTVTIFLPVSLVVILVRAGGAVWVRGDSPSVRLLIVVSAAMLLAVALRQEWATARLGWQVGPANRDLKLRALPCLLEYRTAGTECLRQLYVADGELVRDRAAILERWKLGPFADFPHRSPSTALSPPTRRPRAMIGSLDFVGRRAPSGPTASVRQGDSVSIEGWAVTPELEGAGAVIVSVDGRWLAATARFFARPDVERFFRRPVPACGFRVEIAGGDLEPGDHRVRLFALPPGAAEPVPVPGEQRLVVTARSRERGQSP